MVNAAKCLERSVFRLSSIQAHRPYKLELISVSCFAYVGFILKN